MLHTHGPDSAKINYEYSHFYYSQKFLYILTGIDALKIYGLFVMICWAVKKDTQRSRGLMVSGHLVNFLSSLAMMIFAFVGIYVCP